MDFNTGQLAQMIAGVLVGVALFVLVYRVKEKTALALLVVLIPVQLIDSRYGTLNTVLIYLVSFAYLLQGRLRAAPLFIPVILLLFAYAISFSMSHPAARIHHLFYLVGFVGNFLLFYLVYNFVRRSGDWQFPFRVLFYSNILVIVVCLLEMTIGQSQVNLFGLQEWAIRAQRAEAGRLVGPFGTTHTTSDYFALQVFLLGFFMINGYKHSIRYLPLSVLVLNLMLLVATGDRGGFIVLVAGAFLFLFLFGKTIGSGRTFRYLTSGALLFAAASLVVVQYTQFGVLYERLGATEIEAGVPDTRAKAFGRGLAYFQERPIVGFGPKLSVSGRDRMVADIPFMPYPHNLPLHILATTGLVGFVAWGIFFLSVTFLLFTVYSVRSEDKVLRQMPRLGIMLIALFLLGEMRIEFLRAAVLDFQHYMFVLFGLFVSCADLLKQEARSSQRAFSLGAPSLAAR